MKKSFKVGKSTTKVGGTVIHVIGPLKGVDSIYSYNDHIDGLSNICRVNRDFSVSYDEEEWSETKPVNVPNLNSLIDFDKEEIFIKVTITVIQSYENTPIFVRDIELGYEIDENFEREQEEEKVKDINHSWEINKNADLGFHELGDNFVQLHKDMNNYLNREYGFEVRYFKVEPKKDSIDHFLNEYGKYKEVTKGGKCIKVVIIDNDIPVPTHRYDEWGINFDSFEIHIDKDYFEEEFGKGEKPTNEDWMYFPLVNRLYYVKSNYLERGIQESAAYYVISLEKYDDNTNVEKSEESEEFIDSNTLSHEKLFGEDKKEEMEDMVNDQQNSKKTIADDIVREFVDERMDVVDKEVSNNGNLLIKSFYDMTSIPYKDVAVSYKPKHHLLEDGGWASTQLINVPSIELKDVVFNILSQDRIDYNHVEIVIDNTTDRLDISDTDSIYRFDKIFDVAEIKNNNTIILNTREDIDSSKLDGFKKAEKHNLHTTIEEDINFTIDVYNRDIIRVRYNNNVWDFKGVDMDYEKWYCPVVNVSNTHGYIGVYLWEIVNRGVGDPDKGSTRLENKYKREISVDKGCVVIPEGSEAFIKGSDIKMANVRILNRTIEFEHQSPFMSVRNVHKPSVAFVIDDSEPIFNFGVIGRGNTYITERNEDQ